LPKSGQKIVKIFVRFSKRDGRWKKQRKKRLKFKKGRKKEEEEKYEGFPRPGGDFVAPGNK
jgi:hypothetical protein